MADAKIEVKAGAFSFTGEGTEKWLSGELEKVLAKIPELVEVPPAEPAGDDHRTPGGSKRKRELGTLAQFLKEKNAVANQVKRFLATAIYLHDTTGKNRLTTKEVRNALSTANQPKLGNPASCLNQNVGKGHAEKDGSSGFFVTEAGRTSIGV